MSHPASPASRFERSLPPPLRLPRPRRRLGGMLVSLVFHALILFLLFRHGAKWLTSGSGDSIGPRGGGGGGSAAPVRYVELPAAAPPAPQPAEPVPEPAVAVPVTAAPQTELDLPTPQLTIAVRPVMAVAAVPASGEGTGQGPGRGTGTGGGGGGGVGTGVGNDSGPGRGGGGQYIPPNPRTVLLPADCARGRFTVQFWVAADGHISRVAIDPLPKDAGCRRDMQDRMMGYRFEPATQDGRAVAATLQVQLQH